MVKNRCLHGPTWFNHVLKFVLCVIDKFTFHAFHEYFLGFSTSSHRSENCVVFHSFVDEDQMRHMLLRVLNRFYCLTMQSHEDFYDISISPFHNCILEMMTVHNVKALLYL